MAFLRVVALMLFACTAAAQLPAKMEEPTVAIEMFRVDPTTGSLIRLDKVTSERTGSSTYRIYLPGLQSRVVFPFGERLMFAKRAIGNQTLEEERAKPSVYLERLVPKERVERALGFSSPEGRYATKVYMPVQITTYGEPMYGLDKSGQNRPARTYLYTPTEVLPPGEYAFSFLGLLNGSGMTGSAYSFRIATDMPPTAPPSQSPVSPLTSLSATLSADEMQRGAQQGNAIAQFQLGSAYSSGAGVLQDYVEAHKWLNLAAVRLEGDDRAKAAALRDQIASRMTTEQVAQAQRAAREWMDSFQRR